MFIHVFNCCLTQIVKFLVKAVAQFPGDSELCRYIQTVTEQVFFVLFLFIYIFLYFIVSYFIVVFLTG